MISILPEALWKKMGPWGLPASDASQDDLAAPVQQPTTLSEDDLMNWEPQQAWAELSEDDLMNWQPGQLSEDDLMNWKPEPFKPHPLTKGEPGYGGKYGVFEHPGGVMEGFRERFPRAGFAAEAAGEFLGNLAGDPGKAISAWFNEDDWKAFMRGEAKPTVEKIWDELSYRAGGEDNLFNAFTYAMPGGQLLRAVPKDSVPYKIQKGLFRGATKFAVGMGMSPAIALNKLRLTGQLYNLAQTAVTGKFTIDMLRGVFEGSQAAKDAFDRGDYEKAAEALVETAGSGLMSQQMGKATLGHGLAAARRPNIEGKQQLLPEEGLVVEEPPVRLTKEEQAQVRAGDKASIARAKVELRKLEEQRRLQEKVEAAQIEPKAREALRKAKALERAERAGRRPIADVKGAVRQTNELERLKAEILKEQAKERAELENKDFKETAQEVTDIERAKREVEALEQAETIAANERLAAEREVRRQEDLETARDAEAFWAERVLGKREAKQKGRVTRWVKGMLSPGGPPRIGEGGPRVNLTPEQREASRILLSEQRADVQPPKSKSPATSTEIKALREELSDLQDTAPEYVPPKVFDNEYTFMRAVRAGRYGETKPTNSGPIVTRFKSRELQREYEFYNERAFQGRPDGSTPIEDVVSWQQRLQDSPFRNQKLLFDTARALGKTGKVPPRVLRDYREGVERQAPAPKGKPAPPPTIIRGKGFATTASGPFAALYEYLASQLPGKKSFREFVDSVVANAPKTLKLNAQVMQEVWNERGQIPMFKGQETLASPPKQLLPPEGPLFAPKAPKEQQLSFDRRASTSPYSGPPRRAEDFSRLGGAKVRDVYIEPKPKEDLASRVAMARSQQVKARMIQEEARKRGVTLSEEEALELAKNAPKSTAFGGPFEAVYSILAPKVKSFAELVQGIREASREQGLPMPSVPEIRARWEQDNKPYYHGTGAAMMGQPRAPLFGASTASMAGDYARPVDFRTRPFMKGDEAPGTKVLTDEWTGTVKGFENGMVVTDRGKFKPHELRVQDNWTIQQAENPSPGDKVFRVEIKEGLPTLVEDTVKSTSPLTLESGAKAQTVFYKEEGGPNISRFYMRPGSRIASEKELGGLDPTSPEGAQALREKGISAVDRDNHWLNFPERIVTDPGAMMYAGPFAAVYSHGTALGKKLVDKLGGPRQLLDALVGGPAAAAAPRVYVANQIQNAIQQALKSVQLASTDPVTRKRAWAEIKTALTEGIVGQVSVPTQVAGKAGKWITGKTNDPTQLLRNKIPSVMLARADLLQEGRGTSLFEDWSRGIGLGTTLSDLMVKAPALLSEHAGLITLYNETSRGPRVKDIFELSNVADGKTPNGRALLNNQRAQETAIKILEEDLKMSVIEVMGMVGQLGPSLRSIGAKKGDIDYTIKPVQGSSTTERMPILQASDIKKNPLAASVAATGEGLYSGLRGLYSMLVPPVEPGRKTTQVYRLAAAMQGLLYPKFQFFNHLLRFWMDQIPGAQLLNPMSQRALEFPRLKAMLAEAKRQSLAQPWNPDLKNRVRVLEKTVKVWKDEGMPRRDLVLLRNLIFPTLFALGFAKRASMGNEEEGEHWDEVTIPGTEKKIRLGAMLEGALLPAFMLGDIVGSKAIEEGLIPGKEGKSTYWASRPEEPSRAWGSFAKTMLEAGRFTGYGESGFSLFDFGDDPNNIVTEEGFRKWVAKNARTFSSALTGPITPTLRGSASEFLFGPNAYSEEMKKQRSARGGLPSPAQVPFGERYKKAFTEAAKSGVNLALFPEKEPEVVDPWTGEPKLKTASLLASVLLTPAYTTQPVREFIEKHKGLMEERGVYYKQEDIPEFDKLAQEYLKAQQPRLMAKIEGPGRESDKAIAVAEFMAQAIGNAKRWATLRLMVEGKDDKVPERLKYEFEQDALGFSKQIETGGLPSRVPPIPALMKRYWGRRGIEKREKPASLEDKVSSLSKEFNLPSTLIHKMIEVESRGDPEARSKRGAVGLLQVTPIAAKDVGADWERVKTDPDYNLRTGVRYFAKLLKRFDGDFKKAIAAYNAGPTAVVKHGGVPPFKETIDYVDKIGSSY